MALILPPNWCLIFFRDPEEKFTPKRLKQAIQDAGLKVAGTKQPFEIRCGRRGPVLSVSISRGEEIETIIRGLVGKSRKYRKLIPGCDTQVLIELSDVEAVLDEGEALADTQIAIQEATHGLMYLSWNDVFTGPD